MTDPAGRPHNSLERSTTPTVLAHLSAPILYVLSAGWLSIFGPLLFWLIYKDTDPVTRRASATAFNFNVAAWLVSLVAWALIFTLIAAPVGIPLLFAVFIVSAWCHIKGAIRASKNEPYDYPFQIPILR